MAALRRGLRETGLGRPEVVVVEGPAGIGKSALLAAFAENAKDTAQVTWLRCDQFEQDIPFSAAELLLDEPITGTFSELEVGRRLLARLGGSRSGAGMTILAVDDAHWMDAASARALRFALRRIRVEPVLAVIARRPGGPDVGLVVDEDPQATTVLRPAPLDRSAIDDLAIRMRGWNLSTGTVDRVLEQTGGSPLLISSVLTNAADQLQLETWKDVPASAADAAVRMLDSLPESSRRLVEAAAVLAEPADLVTLGGVAGVTGTAAGISAAAAAGLLTSDHSGISAGHALLREAVYDSLPLDRRQELHDRAARWTSGDRRLGHRAAAVSRPDPALVAELVAAADAARASGRHDLAATCRLRARSISGDTAQRDALLFEALIDRVSAQDLGAADDLAEQAAELTPGPLRSLALGLLARERGRSGEAKRYLHEAIDAAPDPANQRVREQAAVAVGVLHLRRNEGALVLPTLDSVEVDDPELAADAMTVRGLALWQIGDDRAALAHLDAVPISPAGSAREADLRAVRGVLRLLTGDRPDAVADLDRAISMFDLWRPATTHTGIFEINQPYAMRSLARASAGDWDGAVGDAAAARALITPGDAWSAVWPLGVSITIPANRGQWDIAGDHLAATRVEMSRVPYPQVVDWVARNESAIHTARGDHDAHLGLLEPLLTPDHLEQVTAFRSHRWILPAWISTCIEVGRLAEADRELGRYAVLLGRWPGGLGPDRVGWLRGLLAQARGEPDAAREHFHSDLADPATSAFPFVHAQLLHTAGRLELAVGRRRAAITHLTAADDIFTRLGAFPFLERCRLDLAACGLRSPSADPRVLTEREEDVAALVRRGYTNKEVARELFVSPKAVEYHLRGIYSKLGITSRQELRGRLVTSASPARRRGPHRPTWH